MTPLASWRHDVAEIGERGLSVDRSADESELAEIAATLELLGCEELLVSYEIRGIGRGRYRLTGTLEARVIQACVVTLEPLPIRYHDTFKVEFRPLADLPREAAGESDILSGDDPEPIEHGLIDVGRIVFESLSAVLDPFPRKDGAELAAEAATDGGNGERDNPFAILAKLKGGGT